MDKQVLEAFFARLPAPPARRADVEAALARQVAAARAAWPDVRVPDDELAAYLGEKTAEKLAAAPTAAAADEVLAALPVAELALALGCARGDAAALAAFDARYLSIVPAALSRLSPDAATIDEVRQILREKLLVATPGAPPRIRGLAGNGELAGLVRVAAVRAALNLRRRDQRLDWRGDELVDAVAPASDPALAVIAERYRAELKRALEDVAAALPARERAVLRLHLRGLSIDEIGRAYQVHRATAARWLERIREHLDRETRALLAERLGADDAEVASLVRLVESRLEISFQRVLASHSRSP